jgi:hypothetical protein
MIPFWKKGDDEKEKAGEEKEKLEKESKRKE